MDGLSFGEWQRRYRKMRNLTLEALAELASTDKGTLSEFENDPQKKPGHDLAIRIITALSAPPEPFLRALGYPLSEDGHKPDWRAWLGHLEVSDDDRAVLAAIIQRFAPKDT